MIKVLHNVSLPAIWLEGPGKKVLKISTTFFR
jgi:hypothetical protein